MVNSRFEQHMEHTYRNLITKYSGRWFVERVSMLELNEDPNIMKPAERKRNIHLHVKQQ